MNKSEFLSSVREKISGLQQSDMDKWLTYYEEMLQDYMEDGRSEEEAVAAMGTVDEVAAQILRDTPLSPQPTEKTGKKKERRARSSKKILGIVVCVLVLITGIATVGLLSSAVAFTAETSEINGAFADIDISAWGCDVRLVQSENDTCRVVYPKADEITYVVKVEDNTLVITWKDNRQWWQRLDFWNDNLVVTVYLPRTTYWNLSVVTDSGCIETPEDILFENISLQTASGEIESASTAWNNMSVKSTSGKIDLSKNVGGNVVVKTASGTVEMSDMQLDNLEVVTDSGSVTLDWVMVDYEAVLETTSGEIWMNGWKAGSTQITTVSGDVEGNFLHRMNFETATISGSIDVPAPDTTKGLCRISTTSGDIHITVGEE